MLILKLYNIHLRLDEREKKKIPISELLSPVKIPFITVITLSISLIAVCILDTLGYHAERVDFSKYDTERVTEYPMFFLGSLAGILFVIYKVGQYPFLTFAADLSKLQSFLNNSKLGKSEAARDFVI